jgi:FkbM family methyltransferase
MAKLSTFNRQKACRYGQMIYNAHDTYVGRALDLYGEFCQGEVELLLRIVQPGQVVVEVGANTGAHTLVFARQTGRSGAVVAFEPHRVLFQTLAANMALNHVSTVRCQPVALGENVGAIGVPPVDYTIELDFGALVLGNHPGSEPAVMAPLDGFNLHRCDFLAIDTCGSEDQVLRGAVNLLERTRPTIYVAQYPAARATGITRPRGDAAEPAPPYSATVNFLNSLGYTIYWHAPRCFNPQNFFGNATNVFGDQAALKLLCIPARQTVDIPGLERVAIADNS